MEIGSTVSGSIVSRGGGHGGHALPLPNGQRAAPSGTQDNYISSDITELGCKLMAPKRRAADYTALRIKGAAPQLSEVL